jgi:hypothetical protein
VGGAFFKLGKAGTSPPLTHRQSVQLQIVSGIGKVCSARMLPGRVIAPHRQFNCAFDVGTRSVISANVGKTKIFLLI